MNLDRLYQPTNPNVVASVTVPVVMGETHAEIYKMPFGARVMGLVFHEGDHLTRDEWALVKMRAIGRLEVNGRAMVNMPIGMLNLMTGINEGQPQRVLHLRTNDEVRISVTMPDMLPTPWHYVLAWRMPVWVRRMFNLAGCPPRLSRAVRVTGALYAAPRGKVGAER